MSDRAGTIHPSASEGFAAKAALYVQGRPDYPDAIIGWLRERLDLNAGKSVVDLGAGTGKFTACLQKTGAHIIAIEPVRQMREKLMQSLPGVEAREGTAQAIPCPDASVDAVICAQAFHWFATRPALAEILRVLKLGGKLGLIWNMRDERADWVARLTEIIAPYGGDAPRFAEGTWKSVFPFDGLSPLQEDIFEHAHTGSAENVIVNRVRSTSFIAALPAEEEAKVVAQIRALIASTPALAGQETVTVPYTTLAYSAQKTR